MALVRSFTQPFELTDYTQELLIIPQTWGMINQMGLFREEGVSQNNITLESTAGTLALVGDRPRGERNNVNRDDTRSLRSFAIPHFPLDDAIKPEDIQGKRAYGTGDAAETEAAVIARKLERIRRNHFVTMEAARAQALVNGTAYAPNGTVAINYYSEFGITRKEVDFVFGTTTTNIIGKGEEVIAHIQDNILSGELVTGVTAICSPAYFSRLIAHPRIEEAYKFYSSTQEPLRQRLGTGLERRFSYGGIDYVEYRGQYNGTALIPSGEAYFIPTGTEDTFMTYFGPANRFSHVNTIGEMMYAWTFRDQTDTQIMVQSETNFLNVLRRPQVVVRGFSSN